MVTAAITLQGGAKVVIEGTQAEVAALIARLQPSSSPSSPQTDGRHSNKTIKREGPMRLLLDMIDDGFFSAPQELVAVRVALESQGHFYPTTSLSPLMLRLVRAKHLRRIKSQKRWTYVR